MPRVAALMLGAGFARRYGSDKRQVRLADGQSVLSRALDNALAAFGAVTLVLRRDDDPQALALPNTVEVLFNPQSEQGMASSLVMGIEHLRDGDADVIAVLLADMPCIQPATLQQLAQHCGPQDIVLPSWQGQRGHPVLFGRRFWPQLLTLTGDLGGREVVRANADCVKVLAVEDAGVCLDLDQVADLAALNSLV
ncbi:MAG: nucleotidyltransferase family protein [Pseudomonadaceae bacterium]